jgi:hypothetical protein
MKLVVFAVESVRDCDQGRGDDGGIHSREEEAQEGTTAGRAMLEYQNYPVSLHLKKAIQKPNLTKSQ